METARGRFFKCTSEIIKIDRFKDNKKKKILRKRNNLAFIVLLKKPAAAKVDEATKKSHQN
jgi:hypothetical protein